MRLVRFGSVLVLVLVLVAAPAIALHAQVPFTAPRARAMAEMRIDGVAEDLTSTGFVSVGPGGHVVVSQMQDVQFRFYDSLGKEFARFGRRGSGPGEFTSAAVWPGWVGDTLWTYERSQHRLTLISPKVTLVRSVSLPINPDVSSDASAGRDMRSFAPRAVYGDGSMLGTALFARTAPTGVVAESAYVRVSATGRLERIVAARPESEGRVRIAIPGGTPPWISGLIPYFAHPLAGLSPTGDRIVFLTTRFSGGARGTTRLVVLRTTGDTIVSRTYSFVASPIPESIRERAVRQALAQFDGSRIRNGRGRSPYSPQTLRAYEQQIRARMPSHYPPAGQGTSGLTVGRDNSIWLATEPTAEGAPFIVLDADGTPFATVVLPPKTSFIAAATRTHVWALESDADGVPSIVRYRIVVSPR